MADPKLPVHRPVVEDHLLFAFHDHACPVCWQEHAVLVMQDGIFQPCWKCQEKGWELRQKRWRRFRASVRDA